MREIVIDNRGKIMDEGCGTCSHCKPTGNGWYACLQKMKMGIKLEQEDATKHENDTIELKVTRIVI